MRQNSGVVYNSTTTLHRIRRAQPCHSVWTRLLKSLDKTKADDEPLDLLTVLDSNGLDDALWVLSYAMPDDRLARHFQAWCVEQVLSIVERNYPNDHRLRRQIETLRNDVATEDERYAERAAALSAERAAALSAARDAAWDTAWAAAWAAERAAVGDAQEKQLRKMLMST